MNGEVIQDYCEKCLLYTNKTVNIDKNTLTCQTCNSQEDYLLDESNIEAELLSTI